MIRRSFGRSLAGLAGAAVVGLVGAPAVHADEWCDIDPLVKVVTPAGRERYVYVTLSALGKQHRLALHLAKITWKAVPVQGGCEVTISVTVPLDESPTPFPVRGVVSSKPFGAGTVFTRGEGVALTPLQLVYRLNVA